MTRKKNPKRKRTKAVASPPVESGDDVPHKHDASFEDFVHFRARFDVESLNEGTLVSNRFFRAEIFEVLSVGLVVGGSIIIPHLRRAVDRWLELNESRTSIVVRAFF